MTRLPNTRPQRTQGPSEVESTNRRQVVAEAGIVANLLDASPTSAIAVHGRDANEKENYLLCQQMLQRSDFIFCGLLHKEVAMSARVAACFSAKAPRMSTYLSGCVQSDRRNGALRISGRGGEERTRHPSFRACVCPIMFAKEGR